MRDTQPAPRRSPQMGVAKEPSKYDHLRPEVDVEGVVYKLSHDAERGWHIYTRVGHEGDPTCAYRVKAYKAKPGEPDVFYIRLSDKKKTWLLPGGAKKAKAAAAVATPSVAGESGGDVSSASIMPPPLADMPRRGHSPSRDAPAPPRTPSASRKSPAHPPRVASRDPPARQDTQPQPNTGSFRRSFGIRDAPQRRPTRGPTDAPSADFVAHNEQRVRARRLAVEALRQYKADAAGIENTKKFEGCVDAAMRKYRRAAHDAGLRGGLAATEVDDALRALLTYTQGVLQRVVAQLHSGRKDMKRAGTAAAPTTDGHAAAVQQLVQDYAEELAQAAAQAVKEILAAAAPAQDGALPKVLPLRRSQGAPAATFEERRRVVCEEFMEALDLARPDSDDNDDKESAVRGGQRDTASQQPPQGQRARQATATPESRPLTRAARSRSADALSDGRRSSAGGGGGLRSRASTGRLGAGKEGGGSPPQQQLPAATRKTRARSASSAAEAAEGRHGVRVEGGASGRRRPVVLMSPADDDAPQPTQQQQIRGGSPPGYSSAQQSRHMSPPGTPEPARVARTHAPSYRSPSAAPRDSQWGDAGWTPERALSRYPRPAPAQAPPRTATLSPTPPRQHVPGAAAPPVLQGRAAAGSPPRAYAAVRPRDTPSVVGSPARQLPAPTPTSGPPSARSGTRGVSPEFEEQLNLQTSLDEAERAVREMKRRLGVTTEVDNVDAKPSAAAPTVDPRPSPTPTPPGASLREQASDYIKGAQDALAKGVGGLLGLSGAGETAQPPPPPPPPPPKPAAVKNFLAMLGDDDDDDDDDDDPAAAGAATASTPEVVAAAAEVLESCLAVPLSAAAADAAPAERPAVVHRSVGESRVTPLAPPVAAGGELTPLVGPAVASQISDGPGFPPAASPATGATTSVTMESLPVLPLGAPADMAADTTFGSLQVPFPPPPPEDVTSRASRGHAGGSARSSSSSSSSSSSGIAHVQEPPTPEALAAPLVSTRTEATTHYPLSSIGDPRETEGRDADAAAKVATPHTSTPTVEEEVASITHEEHRLTPQQGWGGSGFGAERGATPAASSTAWLDDPGFPTSTAVPAALSAPFDFDDAPAFPAPPLPPPPTQRTGHGPARSPLSPPLLASESTLVQLASAAAAGDGTHASLVEREHSYTRACMPEVRPELLVCESMLASPGRTVGRPVVDDLVQFATTLMQPASAPEAAEPLFSSAQAMAIASDRPPPPTLRAESVATHVASAVEVRAPPLIGGGQMLAQPASPVGDDAAQRRGLPYMSPMPPAQYLPLPPPPPAAGVPGVTLADLHASIARLPELISRAASQPQVFAEHGVKVEGVPQEPDLPPLPATVPPTVVADSVDSVSLQDSFGLTPRSHTEPETAGLRAAEGLIAQLARRDAALRDQQAHVQALETARRDDAHTWEAERTAMQTELASLRDQHAHAHTLAAQAWAAERTAMQAEMAALRAAATQRMQPPAPPTPHTYPTPPPAPVPTAGFGEGDATALEEAVRRVAEVEAALCSARDELAARDVAAEAAAESHEQLQQQCARAVGDGERAVAELQRLAEGYSTLKGALGDRAREAEESGRQAQAVRAALEDTRCALAAAEAALAEQTARAGALEAEVCRLRQEGADAAAVRERMREEERAEMAQRSAALEGAVGTLEENLQAALTRAGDSESLSAQVQTLQRRNTQLEEELRMIRDTREVEEAFLKYHAAAPEAPETVTEGDVYSASEECSAVAKTTSCASSVMHGSVSQPPSVVPSPRAGPTGVDSAYVEMVVAERDEAIAIAEGLSAELDVVRADVAVREGRKLLRADHLLRLSRRGSAGGGTARSHGSASASVGHPSRTPSPSPGRQQPQHTPRSTHDIIPPHGYRRSRSSDGGSTPRPPPPQYPKLSVATPRPPGARCLRSRSLSPANNDPLHHLVRDGVTHYDPPPFYVP